MNNILSWCEAEAEGNALGDVYCPSVLNIPSYHNRWELINLKTLKPAANIKFN